MFILLFVVLMLGSCSCYLRAHLSPAVSHGPSPDFNCYKKLECSKLNLPRLTQSHLVTNSWPWNSSIDGWANRSGWAQLSVGGRKRKTFFNILVNVHSCVWNYYGSIHWFHLWLWWNHFCRVLYSISQYLYH